MFIIVLSINRFGVKKNATPSLKKLRLRCGRDSNDQVDWYSRLS